MVRKPDKEAEEAEEVMAECPFCSMPGPETELQCVSCQNIIPFDVATGGCCGEGAAAQGAGTAGQRRVRYEDPKAVLVLLAFTAPILRAAAGGL